MTTRWLQQHDEPADAPLAYQAALARHAARLGIFNRPIRWFDRVGSTNDVAARLAALGADKGTTAVAAAQTAGRGRRGRAWFSPPGAGLYVSVVLRPAEAGDARREPVASLVTLLGGVAIAEAIRTITALPVELKWPNDVVIGRPRRKVAGILTEATTADGRIDSLVLGFGINVGAARYPPPVASLATSLEGEGGRPVDSAALLVEALAALNAGYHELGAGRRSALLDRWRALSPAARGEPVQWRSPRGILRGTTDGIDDDGALRVRVGPAVERIVAGDVTWL
jgi:BirA family biotin operon repressor/biotin-[acetyl-CoA-carboxylase] ligase